MYKMICLDLDGTVLNDCKEISKENINLIRRACNEKGIICVFATGRPLEYVDEICNSYDGFLTNYIIWGWIVLAYQIEKQDYTLFSRRKLYLFFFLVSIVILASTSKLALLCIGIWIIFRFLIFVFYTLYSGRCRLRAIKFLAICILLAPVFILGIYYCEKEYGTVSFIIEGSGFLGSPSHSYDERSEFTQRLLNIFLEKPLRGGPVGRYFPGGQADRLR